MKNLNNSSILITGGTGSFGQAFIKQLLKEYPKIKRLVIFSRDELKQDHKICPNYFVMQPSFIGAIKILG